MDIVDRLRSVGGYFDEAASKHVSCSEAADEITTLRARIAELEAERGKVEWKSVDEIVPDDWEAILIHGVLKGDEQPTVNEGYYSGGEWSTLRKIEIYNVSHWRLMPTAPSPTVKD